MKKLIVLLIAITTTFASFAQTNKSKMPKAETILHAKYSCSMHPEVVSNKPGKCSKCGMDLTKVKTYSCPMHPGIKSATKGKCPECGMDLIEVKTKSKAKKS